MRDSDPEPEAREWFKNVQTGDLGYLVTRDGRQHIRLDRGPQVDVHRLYRAEEWIAKAEKRPLTRYQLAQVAYAADRQLRLYLGLGGIGEQWIELSDEKRHAWVEKGPQVNPHRRALYQSITGALAPLAE